MLSATRTVALLCGRVCLFLSLCKFFSVGPLLETTMGRTEILIFEADPASKHDTLDIASHLEIPIDLISDDFFCNDCEFHLINFNMTFYVSILQVRESNVKM